MRNFLPLTFLLFFVSALQSAVTFRDVSGLFGSPANVQDNSAGRWAYRWADLQPVCLGPGEELQISLQMPDWSTTFPTGGFEDDNINWRSQIRMWESNREQFGYSMGSSAGSTQSGEGSAWTVPSTVPSSGGMTTFSVSDNPVGIELIYNVREDGGDLLLDLVVVDSSGMIVYETATDGRTVRTEHVTECFEARLLASQSRLATPEPGGMFLALLGGAILTLGSRRR